MAGAHISIRINDRAVRTMLHRLMNVGGDMNQVFGDIAEYLWESTRQRIEDGGPAPK